MRKLTNKLNPKEGSLDWLHQQLGFPVDLAKKHTSYDKKALVIWASPLIAANVHMLRESDKEIALATDHPSFLLDLNLDFMIKKEQTDLRIYPIR